MFSSEKREGNGTSASSLETFADRIDTLAHAVSATAAALAKKDGELVSTRRALEARIGDLETYVTQTLQELRSAAAAAPAKPRAAKRVQENGNDVLLKEGVKGLTSQFEALATRLETMSTRITEHEHELESLAARNGGTHSGVATNGDDQAAERDRQLAGVLDALDALAGRLDVQQERVAALAEAPTSTGEALPEHAEERYRDLELRVQSAVDGLAVVAERLDAQQEDVASLTFTFTTSEDVLRQRVEDLDNDLARQMQDAVGGIAAASERLELLQERISALEIAQADPDTGLEQRVEELSETVHALASERGAAELEPAVPADVEHRLSELDRFGLELRDLLDAVIARVETLGTELDSVAAEPRVDPAELERQFAETGERFDEIVSDLRNLTHILSASMDRDQDELVGRLASLRDDLTAALERIERLETAPAATSDLPAAWVEQLDQELAAVRAKLRQTTNSEEIATQLDAFRVELAKAMGRIERAEEIASRTASNTSSSTSQVYSVIDELRARIDQLDRLEDRLAAKLDRAQALWPVALSALEGRIDDIATTRGGSGHPDEESLLDALEQGVATAHSVIEDAGSAPETVGSSWTIADDQA